MSIAGRWNDYESPEAYAQRRANETRRAYLVTHMGHAWWDTPENRKIADECGGIAGIIKPQRRQRTRS